MTWEADEPWSQPICCSCCAVRQVGDTLRTSEARREPMPGRARARSLAITMVTRRKPTEIGGVERVVTSVMEQLAELHPDWRVDAVSAFLHGGWVGRVAGLSDMIASLRLGWRLRNNTADVIFLHCPECFWGIQLLRKKSRNGPPIVAVWHGAGPVRFLILRKPGHPLAWVLAWLRTIGEIRALSADGHVAVHSEIVNDLRFMYGFTRPVTVIGNAVDPKVLDYLSRTERTDECTGLVALWLGQIRYGKGLDVALAAVKEARKELPDLRLIVAGVPAEKPVDGVEWRGVLAPSEVAEIYRRADLLIFPSRYEAFPLVVIEAMAAGLPVIVSDKVPSGIITDGRNGKVVKGHNPSQYVEALRLLADPQIRARISKANVDDARLFGIALTAADYAAVAVSFAGIQ